MMRQEKATTTRTLSHVGASEFRLSDTHAKQPGNDNQSEKKKHPTGRQAGNESATHPLDNKTNSEEKFLDRDESANMLLPFAWGSAFEPHHVKINDV